MITQAPSVPASVLPDGIQMQMNFNPAPAGSRNRFRENLDNAEFSVMLEVKTPSADANLESALSRLAPLAAFAAGQKDLPVGLAFIDDEPTWPGYSIVDFASALCPADRDKHLIYISGRGRTAESVEGMMAHCRLEGFRNIVCVSGRLADKLPCARSCESVNMLKMNASHASPLFAGTVINPYKYEISAALGQYFKLTKKIHAGAAFAVLQFGLDARKIQELTWQLGRIDKIIPMLARMLILTPGAAEEICSGKYPGICFSRDLSEAVRNEMQHSIMQFEAAQWRRLQLYAAGCRFLGCSGIQLGGIDTPALAKIACQQIQAALSEFKDYKEWLWAYNDYFARMELAPYPDYFYLFENLLLPDTAPDDHRFTRKQIPEPSSGEKFRYNLSKFLFAKAGEHPASARGFSKKMIARCRNCGNCRLPACGFVCPERCPRGMANGPCGEVEKNGKCPYTGTECIHALRLRLANADGCYEPLEENIVE